MLTYLFLQKIVWQRAMGQVYPYDSGTEYEEHNELSGLSFGRIEFIQQVFKLDVEGLQGNYRFYGWHNSGEHEKLKNPRRAHKSGKGFGLSFDQQLSQNVTAFCRFGQQGSDVYEIQRSWSTGFQVSGAVWGRDEDMLGLAYGRADTTGAYRDLLRADGFRTTKAEDRAEAYYLYQLNEHLALSPDFQWVDGLGGSARADSVTIMGIRAQLDF